ncbi:uncharacterized protein [Panulirus ornatus]|uniref:uncharacterized protein isoform X2 n=1 Tax=Panulirus ornatus TaxID=150431 RepID=UPI003A8519B1
MWWRLQEAVVMAVTFLTAASSGMEIKRIPVAGVTGVTGGSAALPCDVSHPPSDSIYLLLWFRDPLTTPIYRLDERSEEENHWWDEDQLGTRASLKVRSSPALLHIASLTRTDQGLYTCRVDFKLQPTKTTRVNLTVIVPPESVEIVVGDEFATHGSASSLVGPYLEGDMVTLTCIAHGGRPRPSVMWYEQGQLLDSDMESEAPQNTSDSLGPPTSATVHMTTTATDGGDDSLPSRRRHASVPPPPPPPPSLPPSSSSSLRPQPAFGGEPFNTLTLGPLTRSHLKTQLTCRASNNNLTLPTAGAVVLDMNLPPLRVEIRPPRDLPLTAGREYQTSEDHNVTTSRVALLPRPHDHGSFLRCIAETFAAPATVEDTWDLDVQYLPTASCSFGASLDPANIKEGGDVYFECTIEANPRVARVSWRHNNDLLSHNVSAGVIISNQSLVLQRVVRAQAGLYSCQAQNLVGETTSNSLRLDIKYAPVCSPGQVTTYAVGRYEDAEVNCSVEANPALDSFQWMFNNTADTIDVPQGRFTSSGGHSVITYTPMTSLDYGTLLCWASNEIGSQREPCVFHIVPAGKPEPPGNCTVGEGTRTSVRVRCVAGGSGGLSQHFLLQASLQTGGGHHVLNLSATTAPDFYVEGLREGGKYQLVIRAVNGRGYSSATHFTINSIGTNGSVYHLHDGPLEAEVRDGGKTGGNGEGSGPGTQSFESLVLPSFIVGVLGVGSGLVLLVILILLVTTFRRRMAIRRRHPGHLEEEEEEEEEERRQHHHHRRRRRRRHTEVAQRPHPTEKSPGRSQTSPVLTPGHYSTCLERDLQAVESESDAEPDVIPLQESCRGCERGGAPPPAATLLPSHRYQYAPVPAHHPSTGCPPSCQHHHPQV